MLFGVPLGSSRRSVGNFTSGAGGVEELYAILLNRHATIEPFTLSCVCSSLPVWLVCCMQVFRGNSISYS